jgi:hypothetical protein
MSAAAPSTTRLAETKAKKQKQIVAVLSVVLLGLLGFELPKMLGGASAQTTTSPTATTASLPGSPLAVTPGGKLPDTDRVSIEPQSGQLISFGLFKSKDPFIQQLSTVASALPSAPTVQTNPSTTTPVTRAPVLPTPVVTTSQPHTPPGSTITGGPVTTTPSTLTPASTVPFASTTPAAPTTTKPTTTKPAVPATAPTSVAISTNGACETVAVNGTFPGDEDIFRVVSIARDGKSAKIAVVGGAYDSGDAAATLKMGEKLTLVNTADGTRYVILLKARCDVETQPVVGGGTTTVAPPTTTTTATTPIVTDALDTTTPTG